MSVWNFTIYKSSRQAFFCSWILEERSQDDWAKQTIRRKRRKNHRNWDWAYSSIQRASVSSERSVWVTTSAWYPGNICFASSKLIACALSGKSVFCNIGWIVAECSDDFWYLHVSYFCENEHLPVHISCQKTLDHSSVHPYKTLFAGCFDRIHLQSYGRNKIVINTTE